jgi:hypothetical protein
MPSGPHSLAISSRRTLDARSDLQPIIKRLFLIIDYKFERAPKVSLFETANKRGPYRSILMLRPRLMCFSFWEYPLFASALTILSLIPAPHWLLLLLTKLACNTLLMRVFPREHTQCVSPHSRYELSKLAVRKMFALFKITLVVHVSRN